MGDIHTIVLILLLGQNYTEFVSDWNWISLTHVTFNVIAFTDLFWFIPVGNKMLIKMN